MWIWLAGCGSESWNPVHRLLLGPPGPCVMQIPVSPPGALGDRAGAWCVPERRSLIDDLVFVDPDHLLVASARDGAALVDLRDGSYAAWPDSAGVRTLLLTADQHVAMGYDSGRLELRSLTGEVVDRGSGFGALRQLVAVDGQPAYAVTRSGKVHALDGVRPALTKGGASWCLVHTSAADPDAGRLWGCTWGGLVEFDQTLSVVRTVPLPFAQPYGATTDADGRVWVVGDFDGVGVWDGEALRAVPIPPGGTPRDVAAMSRGVAVVTWGGRMFYTDPAGPFAVLALERGRGQTVTVSPDGRYVAVGGDFGQVDLRAAAR